jgi:hypothetical protein
LGHRLRIPTTTLRLALGAVGVVDLAWLARSALAAFYWPFVAAGGGGIGSVSVGIMEPLLNGVVTPVPLLLHGVTQVLARRAGADVHWWWWRHVVAVVAGAAGVFLVMRPEHELGGLIVLAIALVLLAIVVGIAQHAVLAIVILSGMQAASAADDPILPTRHV